MVSGLKNSGFTGLMPIWYINYKKMSKGMVMV